MRPLAKLISTFLLLVLTAIPVIYRFVYQVQQRSIQHKMKHRLEKEMLHTFTIEKKDLKWVKPGKEIILGKNMFDIKTITEKEQGVLVITGIYDFEESFLVLQMKKSKQEENSRNNKLAQVLQLMQAILGIDTDEDLIPPPVSCAWQVIDDPRPSSPFRNILTPPPQC